MMTYKKRFAIYRSLFSGYDILLPELIVSDEVDYYLFTDDPALVVYPYHTIVVRPQYNTPSLDNRAIKIMLPEVLKDYEATMYIDANIAIVGDVEKLIDGFINSKADIGLFSHPYHDSLDQEVELCLSEGKCDKGNLMSELAYYSASIPSPAQRLTDNSVILRNKFSDTINRSMVFWFELVNKYSGRDQISLPYVRSKFNLKEYMFGFSPRTKRNKYFVVLPHKKLTAYVFSVANIVFCASYLIKYFSRWFVYFGNYIETWNNR